MVEAYISPVVVSLTWFLIVPKGDGPFVLINVFDLCYSLDLHQSLLYNVAEFRVFL